MSAPLLEVRGLSQVFGGLRALDSVDLDVRQGEVLGLIGPNGAGKSTFFNVLTGAIPGTAGSARLGGVELRGLAPHRVVERGVARTFQNLRLFGSMSALGNVMVGRHCRTLCGVLPALRRGPGFLQEELASRRAARELLAFVGLSPRARRPACTLSYGEQRRLEIARALASEPRLLVLDEPTAGMNPAESAGLIELLLAVRARGVAILLIEHQMRVVLGACARVAVLDRGRKIAEGEPASVMRESAVVEAYLGRGA